jgi:hypothetical protein
VNIFSLYVWIRKMRLSENAFFIKVPEGGHLIPLPKAGEMLLMKRMTASGIRPACSSPHQLVLMEKNVEEHCKGK